MIKSKRLLLKTAVAGAAFTILPSIRTTKGRANASVGNRSYSKIYRETPSKRFLPDTIDQVAQAFEIARSTPGNFRIQSSGHCFAGFSQTPDTLIDLRRLNSTHVEVENKILTAGAGATLADVNEVSRPYNLALPAGYCQTVALGGHVTGGGIGILSREHGLACDHLRSARILLSDGQVTNANSTENSDLFWALRGGGASSFGIILEMTFKLRPTGNMAVVEMTSELPANRAAHWLSSLQELVTTADKRLNFIVRVSKRTHKTALFHIRLVSSAPGEITQQVAIELAKLDKLASVPVVTQGDFGAIANALWPPYYFPERDSLFGSEFLSSRVDQEVWKNVMDVFLGRSGTELSFSIESLGGEIDNFKGNATAYAHRKTGALLLQYQTDINVEKPIELQLNSRKLMKEAIAPITTGGAYMSYPERGLENWAQRYWGQNLKRLMEVKKKYDPENIFHHPQSIPFLSSSK